MSVKDEHPDYVNMLDRWTKCRDAAEGQEAVHKAGTHYLPILSGQTPIQYAAYKLRTPFYNATWRTVSGLKGMLFRKQPKVVVPAVMSDMLQDISLTGETLYVFSQECIQDILTVGRIGIFVDYPIVNTKAVTAADAALQKYRPSLKRYSAENIINWKRVVINNTVVTSRVVLKEIVSTELVEFALLVKTQYRVLDLVNVTSDTGVVSAIYRVRLFEIDPEGADLQIGEDVIPMIGGAPLNFIPFYFFGVDDASPDVQPPPLINLVDINLAHYRVTADYEHGCHFTGLPTPVITGYVAEKEQAAFGIGSTTAWVFPRPDAKAFYLEFTGQGLKALESNLNRKEQQMAILGARMLDSSTSATGAVSAATAAMNATGEQSILATIAHTMSMGLEQALNTFAKFTGSPETVTYRMNRDFFPIAMDALTLTALVASWQNGAIDYTTLFDNLQRAEIVDIDSTVQSVLAGMNVHAPVIPGGTQVNQSVKPVHEITMPTVRQLQTPP